MSEHATEINRPDGTTLVFVDDQNGRYIALFEASGRNLQHISLEDEEVSQLKVWVNALPPFCSKCGKQAPLIAGLLQCEECTGFHECYECKATATTKLMFTSGISEYYCAKHAAIFDQEMIEERELLPLKVFVADNEPDCSIPDTFERDAVLKRYTELFSILPEEYSERGVKIQDALDRLEEMANEHGFEFRNHACRFELVEIEQ